MPDPILMAKAFAAAATMSAMVTFFFGRSSRSRLAEMGPSLAVLGALYAGLWILGLLPQLPPREALDRLLVVVLPLAAVVEMIAAPSGRIGWVGRGTVAVVATPVLLQGTVYVADLSGPASRAWSPVEVLLIFAVLAAALAFEWISIDRLAKRMGDRMAVCCVCGTALGAGLVIMLSGYATGGQVGVPLAAGLAGVVVGSLLGRTKPLGRCGLGVGVVGLFGLVVVGRLFAGLTTLNAILLFSAPLLGWLPEAVPARGRFRVAVRLTLVALPVVIALVLAQQKFAADSSGSATAAEGSLDDYINFGK